MPYIIGVGALWLGSRVLLNASQSVDNVASASQKVAFAALLGAGSYIIYKKAVE